MLQIGDALGGRYRIVSEGVPQDIGTLYKAYDSRQERLVAILVLSPRFGGSGEVLERLTKSQQAVAGLDSFELVPVDDAGGVDGQLYLVRRLVDGHLLAELLARIGPLSFDAAVQVAIHLCDALAPAHRAGLVHGSLSPYSVLVQDNGQVLVTDVGLLPALQPLSALPGRPWGRVPYLSPEQAAGEAAHPASDVYVVGCLLYEMLAGRPPFHARDEAVLAMRHLRQSPPSLQVLVPDIPLALVQIVDKALAKEPAARYRNAGQLATILRSQLNPEQEEPVVARPTPRRERLVVPAPPVDPFDGPGTGFEDWTEEPAGVDWLMIALIVTALIAVLGLIPLWRTVYRHYAPPSLTPMPALVPSSPGEWTWLSPQLGDLKSGAKACAKLDDFGLAWYNSTMTGRLVGITANKGVAKDLAIPWADALVRESRLRVLSGDCDIL